MRVISRTVLEAIILGVIGVALGFGVNAVRGSGAVDPTRDYFNIGERPVAETGSPTTPGSPATVVSDRTGDRADEPDKPPPKHPYQVLAFDKIVEIFEDPSTEMGANVFIDSRSRELYEDGHILGAIHADHYHIEEYVDHVLATVEGADRVIVYCEGGDCEDSIFMCTDLIELDVPFDVVYLYPGGWKEWIDNDMPIVMGSEPQ